MTEFIIKPKAVIKDKRELDNIRKVLKSKASELEALRQKLNSDSSTREIATQLGNIIANIECEEAYTRQMQSTLEQIVRTYQKTEQDIMDKSLINKIIDFCKNFIDGLLENNGSNNGGNLADYGDIYDLDPVNMSTGNYISDDVLFEIKGLIPISLKRYYNSMIMDVTALGRGWNHTYNINVEKNKDDLCVNYGDGRKELFVLNDNGVFENKYGRLCSIKACDNGYIYSADDSYEYEFSIDGKLQKIADRFNNCLLFEYEDKLLKSVTRSDECKLNFEYNDEGYIIAINDHTGRKCEFEYDENSMTSYKDNNGNIFKYEYAKTGMLQSITDPNETCALYNIYDDSGRVVSQLFPDDIRMEIEYHPKKNESVVTDKDGSHRTYIYDDKHRHVATTYDDGTEEKWNYNSNNKQTSYNNNRGADISLEYDEKGNVIKEQDCYGNTAHITYDENGRPIVTEYPNGAIIRNVYDPNGNQISQIDARGFETHRKYNNKGQVIEITKPDGYKKMMKYDSCGNVIEISDSFGAVAYFKYDSLNRVSETIDANGNSTCYEYNNRDNVVQIKNAEGNTCTYEYNYSGKVTHCIDFDNGEIFYEYNSFNQLIKVTDKKGHQIKYKYDQMGNLIESADYLNNIRQYIYNEKNLLAQSIDEENGITSYEYDLQGNRTKITEPCGNKVDIAYDKLRRISSILYPDNTKVDIEYDSIGNVISRKSTDGIEIKVVRDKSGNITERHFQDGRIELFEYNELGKVKKHVQTNKEVILFDYYPGGRLKAVRYPDGRHVDYKYDGCGNIISISRDDGYFESRKYDCMNRLKKICNANNETTIFTYDSMGRILTVENANGTKKSYEYDINGNRIKYEDELGNYTKYRYDDNNRLLEVLKTNSDDTAKIKYTRDAAGRICAKEDVLGNGISYEYAANGQLIRKVDRNGHVFIYSYDTNNRLSEIKFDDNDFIRYTYDAAGNVAGIENSDGILKFERNPEGNITSVSTPKGQSTRYEYTDAQQLKTMIYPNGFKVDYEYDRQQRVSEVKDRNASYRYEYNNLGKVSKCSSGKVDILYGYNNAGRISAIEYKLMDKPVSSCEYEYDNNGNILRKCCRNFEKEDSVSDYKYTYDSNGQLKSTYHNGSLIRTFAYDDNGNRTELNDNGKKTIYKYNDINQLIQSENSTGKREYLYDRCGNLVSEKMDGKVIVSYKYDARNRLIEREDELGKIRYSYDAINNLIGISDEKDNKKFLIDYTRSHNNIIAELSDHESDKEFLWADRLIGMSCKDESFTILSDSIGSVMKVIDSDMTVREEHVYDEFGNDFATGEKVQSFGFAGVYSDRNLYHMKYRKYDSSVGRFLEEDPVENKENWYIYVSNNPLKFTDPLGLAESKKDLDETPDWMYFLVQKMGDIEICGITVDEGAQAMVDGFAKVTQSGMIDGALAFFDFETNGDGIYHTNPDCWQRIGGYNNLYDYAFDVATSMKRSRNDLEVKNPDGSVSYYSLWSWKGDYLNLGAGAETGLYKKSAWEQFLNIDHYSIVGKDERVPMELVLYNGDELLYDYKPGEDQWWITGFDSNVLGVDANDLTVRGSMDLSGNEALYDALKKKANGSVNGLRYDKVCFNDETKSFYYEW
mgnify:CR=1 FL=1